MKNFLIALLAIVCFTACQSDKKQETKEPVVDSDKLTLFVGTYTRKEGHVDGQGEGIYVYEMDKKTGALSYVSTSESVVSPSYLAVHPNKKTVFAVNEFDGGEDSYASITEMAYDEQSRELTYMTQSSTLGQYPCHVSIDNTGKFVMAANYVGGSVILYPINEDGLITESSSYRKHEGKTEHPRQEAPHAHMIVQHPTKGWVFAVDLGADKIYEYKLDTLSRTLDFVEEYPSTNSMSGPRHMAFHPEKEVVYVLNELNGTVETLKLTDESRFKESLQVISTMAEGDDRDPASGAIKVHPSGRFLYASNRGEVNNIAVFSISSDGTLTAVGRQSTFGNAPRDFEIDPSGTFVLAANQNTNTVVTFRINQQTGMLEETGIQSQIPTPVCLKFLGD
ncbi:MAG: lactonase family protein [Roseivirga sp.]|nr:lactonase family protein [Roseivirga sp.]